MAVLFSPDTDTAAQVAVAQGVDSNVYQSAGTPPLRHPAMFTSIEGSAGVLGRGRVAEDTQALRVFGRLLGYEPLGERFESRTGRAGLAYGSATRVHRRAAIATTLTGTVGSLQAARGTDGALTLDPVSTRRSAWTGAGGLTLTVDYARNVTLRVLTGLDLSGTLSEQLPGQPARRGLDFVIGRARFTLAQRTSQRTLTEASVLVERMHTAYVLAGGSPTSPNLGAVDSAAVTATLGFSHRLRRDTVLNAAAGVTLAVPRLNDAASVTPAVVAPAGALGVLHDARIYALNAGAGLQYGLSQARLGPGVTAQIALGAVGRPLSGRARERFELVAEATAQRTGLLSGPNGGVSVTAGGAGLMVRLGLGAGLGLLVGYDVRATQVLAQGADPFYLRHLGFVGLSFGFSGRAGASAMPTLMRPAASPFAT